MSVESLTADARGSKASRYICIAKKDDTSGGSRATECVKIEQSVEARPNPGETERRGLVYGESGGRKHGGDPRHAVWVRWAGRR